MENSATKPIGIIGVGLVGNAIADRLSAAGWAVMGYDLAPIENINVTVANSATDVCTHCTTVFLSLPTSEVVANVLDEVAPALTPDHLFVDTTTGDPEDAAAHVACLASFGAAYLEATVAGSSDLLRKGEAPIFVGGEEPDVERARPLLEILNERLVHLGPAGAASRFKLVFNLVLGLHRAVLAEALNFGEALGFAPATVLEVLENSPAYSPVMTTKGQRMAERSYDPPQARLSQHLKDVRLILAQAARKGASVPLSELHRELLERAEEYGFGDSDTSAVREAFRTGMDDPDS